MTTPSGSGTDIVSLGISVDATQPENAAKALDAMGTATITVVKNLDELIVAADKESAAISKSTATTRQKIEALNAQFAVEQEVLKLQKEQLVVQEMTTQAGQNLIAKLEQLNLVYGLTREEVFRLTAAQLDVAAAAEPLIASIETLKAATAQYGVVITDLASIETARIDFETRAMIVFNAFKARTLAENAAAEESAMTALNAQRARALAEQAAMEESAAISLSAFKARTLAENREAAIVEIDKMEKIRLADLEKQKNDLTIFNAFKIRTLEANAQEAIAIAEKEAIAEIKWNQLSVKTRIEQLEQLKAYQANAAIRPETISSTFSSAALNDLPNLTRLQNEYNASLTAHNVAATTAATGTNVLGAAMENNRVRTEALVIAHEALQGRYTRIPGSIMVMTEYLNSASVGMTGFTMTTLAAVGALVLFGYEIIKGIEQQKAFYDALNRSNNASGETVSHMRELADSIGSVKGHYTEAYEAIGKLAASGKFTADQIDGISRAVVDVYHAFGTPIQDSIKEFESLIARSTSSGARGVLEVSRALEDLNVKYHFVTSAVLENVIALEKEGKQREASAISIKELEKEQERAAHAAEQYAGWIELAWNGVTRAIRGTIQAMADVGKQSTDKNREQTLINQLPKNKDGSLMTDESKMNQTDLYRYKEYLALEQEQVQTNNKRIEQQDKITKQDAADRAIMQVSIENMRLEKKTNDELADALARRYQQYAIIAANNPDDPAISQHQINEDYLAIVRDHTRKAAAIKDDGRKQDLQSEIDNETAKYNLTVSVNANTRKLVDEYYKQGEITAKQYYDSNEASIESNIYAATAEYNAKMGFLNKYSAKDEADKAETKKRIVQTTNDYIKQIEDITAAKDLNRAKEKTEADQTYNDTIASIIKQGETEIDALNKSIAAQRLHNSEIGKTQAQKETAKQQDKDELTRQYEHEKAFLDFKIESEDYDEKSTAAFQVRSTELEKIISLRKEDGALLQKGSILEAQAADQKAWDTLNKKISNDLVSAIVDGGDKGIKRLIREMEVQFAKMVLQPILAPISAALTNVVSPIVNSALGLGSAGSSALGAAGSLSSLYNAGSSAYTWLGLGGSALGSGVATGAGAIGTGIAAGTGGATLGSGLALGSGAVGSGAASGAALGSGVAVGEGALGAGTTAASGLTAALGAVPVWGWVALAAIAAYGIFGGNKEETNTRLQFTSNNTPGNISINERGNQGQNSTQYIGNNATSAFGTFGINSTYWMNADQSVVQDFIKTVGQTDDALAQFLTTTEKANVTSSLTGKTITAYTGAESDNPNATGQLDKVFVNRINMILEAVQPGLSALEAGFSGNSQELATEAQSLLAFRAALKASGEAVFGQVTTLEQIAALKQPTEATSVALNRIANEFVATNAIAAQLGKTSADVFGAVGLASLNAREQLITFAGGVSTLSTQINTYNQDFLTQAEQLAPVQAQLNATLTTLGLAFIDSRDKYKSYVQNLVDSGALATEAGARQYTELLALADAFNVVYPATTKTVSAEELLSQQRDLESKLLELQGDKLGSVVKARESELAATDDSLKGLQQQVYAYQDLKDAQDAYDSAAQAGTAAMADATNKYEAFVSALVDAQSKYDEAIKNIQDAYSSALTADNNAKSSVLKEQENLVNGYLSASDRVAEAQKKISETFYQVATDLGTFLTSLNTTDIGVSSPFNQLASLKDQFADTVAKAKGGDTNAAESLPDIAKQLLAVGKDTSSTSVEFARIVASIHSSILDVQKAADAKGTKPEDNQSDLDKALIEQKQWYDAVIKSGSDLTISSSSVLQAYKLAVATQEKNSALTNQAFINAANAVIEANTKATNTQSGSSDALTTSTKLILDAYGNVLAVTQQNATKTSDAIILSSTKILDGYNNAATAQQIYNSVLADQYDKATGAQTDSSKSILDAFSKATVNQSSSSDDILKAYNASVASQNKNTDTLLDGYNKAVAAQQSTATDLAYWTKVLQATGISIDNSKTETAKQGDILIKAFYSAQTALNKAAIDLDAANKIKAGLDLKTTTSLEDFAAAIKDVNEKAKTASEAAAALFAAASKDLVAGSAMSVAALSAAKDGMTYWGSVVTSTASGVANSVAAIIAAAAALAAATNTNNSQSNDTSQYASSDERLVRSWYANNSQFQSNHTPVTNAEVQYWMNALQTSSASVVKQQFAVAAARDAGFSTPLDVSQFQTGGVFTNSIVNRPTKFAMGEMGENGPEAIMPLTQINGKLGVRAQSGGDSSSEARIRALETASQDQGNNIERIAKAVEDSQDILKQAFRNGRFAVITETEEEG